MNHLAIVDEISNVSSLAIRDIENALTTSSRDWTDMVDSLLCELIISHPSKEYMEIITDKVLIIYYQNLKIFKGDIDMEDIMGDIEQYNSDILMKIAEIEFKNDPYRRRMLGIETREEILEEIYDEYIEMYNYNYFEYLELTIRKILDERRMFYLVPSTSDFFYENFGAKLNIIITVNDCQNTLFDELITEGQKYFKEYDEDIFKYRVWCA